MDIDFIPDHQIDQPQPLKPIGGALASPPAHLFSRQEVQAVNNALAVGRPLLVRGEPGIGKSQLARAAAAALGRTFIPFVVDARTESRDLLWHFDAVDRLAQAQVQGFLCKDNVGELESRMAVANFLTPGPLWWAFNWQDAEPIARKRGQDSYSHQPDGGSWEKGCVVLIDEIDKAESDVPNGLLEALGISSFTPQGRGAVTVTGIPPLVIVTTNEERALPDAFVRRCLVLHLNPPNVVLQRDAFEAFLVARGNAHFAERPLNKKLLAEAATLVAGDRLGAAKKGLNPLAGVAEYLDLVRAVVNRAGNNTRAQIGLLREASLYVVKKHPELHDEPPAP